MPERESTRPHHHGSSPPDAPVDLAHGPVSPHRLLADRFFGYVDDLLPGVSDVSDADDREHLLDILVGLSAAGEALGALARARPEHCVDHLDRALRHLRGTPQEDSVRD
jgi:hypothetical protein